MIVCNKNDMNQQYVLMEGLKIKADIGWGGEEPGERMRMFLIHKYGMTNLKGVLVSKTSMNRKICSTTF